MAPTENLQEQIQQLRAMRCGAPTRAAATTSAGFSAKYALHPNRADAESSVAGLLQLSAQNHQQMNHQRIEQQSAAEHGEPSLPMGWTRVMHESGLPCYVHEKERLVCWSRPYQLPASGGSFADFERQVRTHVPMDGIFSPPEMRGYEANTQEEAVNAPEQQLYGQRSASKKRKLESVETPEPVANAPNEKQHADGAANTQPMTQEEFDTLSIGDPRVLQACMTLSIKTPAQVLQEYQNRNRGVSINYNTVAIERNGTKLFKTIVTAGSTAAEGEASTKKVAKQLGAQQLLVLLHANSTQTYKEVAELYRSNAKGVPVVKKEPVTASVIAAPVSTPAPALLSAPPSNDAYIRGPQDKRATRGPLLAKPMHRQSAPIRHQAGGYGGEQSIRAAPYARGNSNVAPWNGYQQHQQYSDTAWGRDNNGPPQQHGGAPFAPGRARIVEYAPPPAGGAFAAPPQHYPVDNWGYNRSSMPPPSAYSNAAIYGAGAAPFGRPSAQDLVYDYRGATNSANLERVKNSLRIRLPTTHPHS